MSISIHEFKSDVERYMLLAQTEDLYVTIGTNIVVKLTNPNADRRKIANSLLGCVPADVTLEQSRDMKAEELLTRIRRET